MKTKIVGRFLLFCLFGTLFTGCTEEEDFNSDAPAIELHVSSGLVAASRTTLPGPHPVQHVTRVSLYIFHHENPTDTLGAKCIYSMSFDEVNWNQAIKEAQTNGAPTQVQRITLPKDWMQNNKPGDTYTFLAIGSDEKTIKVVDSTTVDVHDTITVIIKNSTETYGLNPLDLKGKTLGTCYAELQQGMTMDKIHHSELFAGTVTLRGGQVNSRVKLHLYRRVAGIKGYFRRIPDKIEHKEVTSLRVVYWQAQNTAVPFFERQPKDGVFMDYDNRNPSTSNSSQIPDKGHKIDPAVLDSCTFFEIPKEEFPQNKKVTGKEEQQEQKVDFASNASYVLPAPGAVGEDKATMYVLLLASDNTILDKRRIFYKKSYTTKGLTRSDTDLGTGIIGNQKPNADALNKQRRYPIVANNYYTIGTADEPIDLSTGETETYFFVDPSWEGFHKWGNVVNVN